VCNIFQFLH
ncbi:hypothetical protein DMN91_006148, partial [Ooceraea biroi]